MPPARISPELQQQIKRSPLPSRAETDRVMRGDLAMGSQRYAAHAATEPSAWVVWLAIEAELGNWFEQSVAGLPPDSCEGLARWGFDAGRDMVAMVAYRRFLEAGSGAPSPADVEAFVRCVRDTEGEAAAQAARALADGRLPRTAAPAPVVVASATPPAARAGVSPPAGRVAPPPVVVAPAPLRPQRVDRGLRPAPSEGFRPHSFGGFDLQTPTCPGCRATIRLWFSIDVEADPKVAALLPGWAILPLVACAGCEAWRFQHDFQIDEDFTTLSLLRVAADANVLAGVDRTSLPVLTRQSVALTPVPAGADEPGLQIAGEPLFRYGPMATGCPRCGASMRYVGTLATPSLFASDQPIRGVLHHFACPGCRTLSVIAET